MKDAVVNINGTLCSGDEARVSVFDRGFLFGDSVYEVLRTQDGRPCFWEAHVERLMTSAALLSLDLGATPTVLRDLVEQTLVAVRSVEKYIRVIVTRGEGDLSLAGRHGPPTRVVIARPLTLLPDALYADGCALSLFPLPAADAGSLDPRAKTGDRRLGVLAEQSARAQGAHEALRVAPDGRVLEGASSTFFVVRDGALLTPPLQTGILAGITRAKVLVLARAAGVAVREVDLPAAELGLAQEAFITSTLRGLLPVNRIDAVVYGAPGPVTRGLMAAYGAMLQTS